MSGATLPADEAIVKAIGEELRQARAVARWSRPELVKKMTTLMPVNTYACYEQGIRQCSIPRLVEICQVLGTSSPELLGRALQRLGLDDPGVPEELRLLREIRNYVAQIATPREE